jgi:hypothetical protein
MGGGAFNLLKTGCIGPESEKQPQICLVESDEDFIDLVRCPGAELSGKAALTAPYR